MTCENRCLVREAVEIPSNNMPPPAGGGGGDFNGITTGNTTTIQLVGNGTQGNPLRANLVQPLPIEFEISFSVPQGITAGQVVLAYPVGQLVTIESGLPGARAYARGLGVTAAAFQALKATSGGPETLLFNFSVDQSGNITTDLSANAVINPGETLLIIGNNEVNFSVVGLTFIALRNLALAV